MKFCPKCTLKINGSINQCPICKVDLEFRSDDQAVQSSLSPTEPRPFTAANTTPDHSIARHISSPLAPPRLQEMAATSSPISSSDDASLTAVKLTTLEEQLNVMMKMLNQCIEKEDALMRSLVRLESVINKITSSRSEVLPPNPSAHPMEQNGTIRITSDESDLHPVHDAVTSQSMLQQRATDSTGVESESFSVPRDPYLSSIDSDTCDAPSMDAFFDTPDYEFDASHASYSHLRDEVSYPSSNKEKRKLFLIIIPFLCLCAIFLFLLIYYNGIKKQAADTLVITEPIIVPSASVETISDPSASSEAQTESNHALADAPPSPTTIYAPLTATDDGPSRSVSSSVDTKPPATTFLVSVGSFKEKRNALALTNQLIKKGYAANMNQLPQKNLYRVTVGTFSNRSEALAMASRLQKNEQLQTAIVVLPKP